MLSRSPVLRAIRSSRVQIRVSPSLKACSIGTESTGNSRTIQKYLVLKMNAAHGCVGQHMRKFDLGGERPSQNTKRESIDPVRKTSGYQLRTRIGFTLGWGALRLTELFFAVHSVLLSVSGKMSFQL